MCYSSRYPSMSLHMMSLPGLSHMPTLALQVTNAGVRSGPKCKAGLSGLISEFPAIFSCYLLLPFPGKAGHNCSSLLHITAVCDSTTYHFVQENIAIFSQLDVTSTRHKPAESITIPYPYPYISFHISQVTYIFMVPLGPRLVLKTSCRPLAAVILTCSAWAALATSAFGFRDFTAAI